MTATHLHTHSKEPLRFIQATGLGDIAIFEKVGAPYCTRITCPATPDFVIGITGKTIGEEVVPAGFSAIILRDIFSRRVCPAPKSFHGRRLFK